MDLVLQCSISPTGLSPHRRALLYGLASPCAGELAHLEKMGLGEERACCVSRKLRGGGAEGRRGGKECDLGVPWEWTSLLLCFLIPCNAEQQGSGEGPKVGGGWWGRGWRNRVFTLKGSRWVGWGRVSVFISEFWRFYLCSKPGLPEVSDALSEHGETIMQRTDVKGY